MRNILRILGLIMISSSLTLKVLFNHDFESYSSLYTANTFMNTIGLVILLYPLIERLQNDIPASFQLYPKKWLISYIKLMSVIFLVCGIHLSIMISGEYLNESAISYQINKNPGVVVGIVENEFSQELTGKYKRSFQRYKMIKYTVDDRTHYLRIRVDRNEEVKKGKREMVKYYKENPSLAMIERK